ncbi:DoxX family protein [Anaerosporomusa subterranea]|uniref:DoxX family protein n=1 Tax=Anaerosporomusa subterranea TaxID=1794912 RepID=A0A154BQ57_ANASB|nr:DoxX family protein [Anaerosporomusa subterranea]KYZ76039.1 DoxX family protein [Anaerosporomusa subterranea]
MKSALTALAKFLSTYRDLGLLVFRLVLGGMFMWHGWPKIVGGPAGWEKLGQAMGTFGITFAPTFWGFMASFSEFGGGLMVALGLFYRIGALLLFFTMFTAFNTQMVGGKGLSKASQSLEDGFSFLAAAFIGPGKYSLDYLFQLEETEKRGPR